MYRVTIRKEGHTTLARDDAGRWRSYCPTPGSPPHGRELAEWIFHREEVGHVYVDGDATVAEILEGDEIRVGLATALPRVLSPATAKAVAEEIANNAGAYPGEELMDLRTNLLQRLAGV